MIELTLRSIFAAVIATAIVAPLGGALGYAMSRWRSRAKPIVDTVISLPLVLPPVAVGVLLLWALAPNHSLLGRFLEQLGLPLLGSFGGVVVCAAVMGFPLMARSAEAAFAACPPIFEEAAINLGARRSRALRSVSLPIASRGLVYGASLAFARGLGEFGATMVLVGYRPGSTDTLSLGIYFAYDQFENERLIWLMAISIALCFATTLIARILLGDLAKSSTNTAI